MRLVLTLIAYLAALAGVAGIAYVVVMLLAGPHTGLLPGPLESLVLIQAWFAVVALPVLAARYVWIRSRPERGDGSGADPISTPMPRDVAQLTADMAAPAAQLVRSDTPTGSHLGGSPHLPAGMPWPQWRGRQLDFMARLSLSNLQATTPIDWLPASGALLFFYDAENQPWGFDPADRGSCVVLHVSAGETHDARSADDGAGELFPRVDVRFQAVSSLPSPERGPASALSFSDEERASYEDLRDAVYGEAAKHQVGGFPFPVQNDTMELEAQLASNGLYCGDGSGYVDPRAQVLAPGASEWRLLLQLDTDDDAGVMWGDCGTLYFWVRAEDASQGRFDNPWLILQCS